MAVPILRFGTVAVASLQSELTDSDWRALQMDLLASTTVARVGSVVIDVSGMDVVDSYAARTLASTGSMLRMRGVRTLVAGIHPDVAIAMVRLGLTLSDVTTCLDLEAAFAALGIRQVPAAGRHV